MSPAALPWHWPWWLAWIPVRVGVGGLVDLPAQALRVLRMDTRTLVYLANGQLWRVCLWWPRIGGVVVVRWPMPVVIDTPPAPPPFC